MKGTHQISTGQFEYINLEAEGTMEEIVESHKALQRAWKGNDGIPEKELNPVIDAMLLGETVKGGVEIYEKLSDQQRYACQVLKRALARLKAREGETYLGEPLDRP